MKFQKDISDLTVAPNSSKQVVEEENLVDGRNPEIMKRIKEDRKIMDRSNIGKLMTRQFSSGAGEYQARTSSYPPIIVQLDMLWHDIDSGKINANTTAEGPRYHRIKMIKENNPMPKKYKKEFIAYG